MNNEQTTLMNLLRILTEYRCNKIDGTKALESMVYFLDEFMRKENS
jgi:hypothetical protein